jgi:hypothetical protein
VKEQDARLSAPSPPRDKSAPPPVQESPFGENNSGSGSEAAVESSESVKLPGDAGFLQLRIVPDDNSCLFSAVGVVFEGGIEAAQKLRKGELELESGWQAMFRDWIRSHLRHIFCRPVADGPKVVADAIRADPDNYSDAVLG